MNYVLGFAFQDPVLWLIRKRKPAWQAGRLNGIGGHMEEGETRHAAMSREFQEETGIIVSTSAWRCFGRLKTVDSDGKGDLIWLFTSKLLATDEPTAQTEEPLVAVSPNLLPDDVIDNLNWLVPMARAHSPVYAAVQEVYV